MMQIYVLGSGAGLPSANRNCSGYAIEHNDEIHLFDCGSGVPREFLKAKLDPKKVKSIFISHMHPDHVGDLPRFIQLLYHSGRHDAVNLFMPAEAIDATRNFLNTCYLYNEKFWFDLNLATISTGMISQDGLDIMPIANNHLKHKLEFCREHKYPNKCECYSFRISCGNKIVFYSADIKELSDIAIHIASLDLLIIETGHIDLDEFLEVASGKSIDKIILTHIPDEKEKQIEDTIQNNKYGLNLIKAHDGLIVAV